MIRDHQLYLPMHNPLDIPEYQKDIFSFIPDESLVIRITVECIARLVRVVDVQAICRCICNAFWYVDLTKSY